MNAEDGIEGQQIIFLCFELRVYYRMLWTNLVIFNRFVKKKNCFDVRAYERDIFLYVIQENYLRHVFVGHAFRMTDL
jgi:hypothetical protein